MIGDSALEFGPCHAIRHLGQKVWKIKDERSRSEVRIRWRGGEIRTTQPNQRSLQVRCNGKDARTGEEYTLAQFQKSNKIWLRKKPQMN
jgi:hypothetical protein